MGKKKLKQNKFKKYLPYYILFIPCAVGLIMFSYIPMGGLVLAFKDFIPRFGIYNSPFANPLFKHFTKLFEDTYFWTVCKNTVLISLYRLALGFPFPIFLALIFNELRWKSFSKFVQTVLFIPYFISWVVLAGMLRQIFSVNGLVNTLLGTLHLPQIKFLTTNVPFLLLIVLSDIWKGCGYGMIIYLASITSIDAGLYEAVEIDGGNRFHKMVHITLPGISNTIAIQLILSLSGILNGGFDQIFNLYSDTVYEVADILDTYLYRTGIADGKYELGTALGLFKSLIGFVLVLLSNWITKLLGGDGIW